MRFGYDGTRQSASQAFAGLPVHSFYLNAVRPIQTHGTWMRMRIADEAVEWCGQHIPNRFVRVTNFQFEIYEDNAAMEFRLRWC